MGSDLREKDVQISDATHGHICTYLRKKDVSVNNITPLSLSPHAAFPFYTDVDSGSLPTKRSGLMAAQTDPHPIF